MTVPLEIPLVDLAAQHAALRSELISALSRVLDRGTYILGPEVAALESELGAALGVGSVVGVSSGTDALLVALLAAGVGPGDEVVTTSFSFFATVEAILRTGARPVLVDVHPETACLDPDLAARAVGPRTRALLPVHLFGVPASPVRLVELAADAGVMLIEDAAQAFGASVEVTTSTGARAVRAIGSFGCLGCFSFFPSKPLGGLGDGGAIATSDEELAARCRELRSHGSTLRHHHTRVGGNFRLDELQAALLRVKLPLAASWRAERARHAATYDSALGDLPGLSLLAGELRACSAHAHYVVRVHDGLRPALMAWLRERGISSAVYYPRPLHLQPALADLGWRPGSLPESERCAEELLALPLYPELSPEQLDRVIDGVRSFLRAG